MAIRYTQFFNQMQSLIDSIDHDSDPAERLNNLQRIYKDSLTIMIRSRDQAAYDLRMRYSSTEAERLAGVNRKYIDYWANRYRKAQGLPALKKKTSIDLSQVIDLSGGQASPPVDTPLKSNAERQG
jgi:hypothetical protein